MKGLKPFLFLLLACLTCALLSGCAGSVPQNGPGALNIAQFALSQGVPGVAYRQLLVATGGSTPYTWSVSSGTLPPGLTLSNEGIISGTPTATGASTFTAKVVDSQTPTEAVATQSFTITINPPLALTSTPLISGLVGSTYSADIQASNGVQPYTYSIAAGRLPPCAPAPPCTNGTMALTTNPPPMGGGPNSATIATPIGSTLSDAGTFSFTIQVTDALSEVATATFTITVTGRLQGSYSLSVNAYSHDQPVYLVGSFVADGNGNITSGVFDQSGPGSSSFTNVQLMPSTYSLPLGSNVGTINLISSRGTYRFAVTLSTTTDSTLIMTNSNFYGSGVLRKQTTMALPPNASSYAFGFFGNDSGGNRLAGAGMFALSSLNVTGGAEDTNDNGTASGELSITSGTMSSPDGITGRGTLSLPERHRQRPARYLQLRLLHDRDTDEPVGGSRNGRRRPHGSGFAVAADGQRYWRRFLELQSDLPVTECLFGNGAERAVVGRPRRFYRCGDLQWQRTYHAAGHRQSARLLHG